MAATAPPALHNLGDAIDVHELVDELAVALLLALTTAAAATTVSAGLALSGFLCHQNSNPLSRAASASALMRPWKR